MVKQKGDSCCKFVWKVACGRTCVVKQKADSCSIQSCMWVNVRDGGKEQIAAAAYLISCSGHAASFVNEGEHSKGRVDWRPLQEVKAVLVVYELHIAPVNALSSILLLHHVSTLFQITTEQARHYQLSGSWELCTTCNMIRWLLEKYFSDF